jgi:hypothetical protein
MRMMILLEKNLSTVVTLTNNMYPFCKIKIKYLVNWIFQCLCVICSMMGHYEKGGCNGPIYIYI